MRRTILGLLSIVFLTQSCIISLHPLYTNDKITYFESLEGKWQDTDTSMSNDEIVNWEFEKHGKGYHLMRYGNQTDTLLYEAVLLKLGDHLFMDIMAILSDKEEEDIAYKLPTHNFVKVLMENKQLKLVFFDSSYLEDLFKKRKIRLKHEKVEDTIVLTASSEELQKFILKYANDPKAFSLDEFSLEKL